jgi:hypothetical protein
MPPGNERTRQPAKVIEKATAEACIAIAQRVARTRYVVDDWDGWSAADLISHLIELELLDPVPQLEGGQDG